MFILNITIPILQININTECISKNQLQYMYHIMCFLNKLNKLPMLQYAN